MQPSASIEELLNKDECSLEELLDDEDLIQECKNMNNKLINFFTRERIRRLIKLITVMPEVDEHKRGHKYPYVASEIFNCEIYQVLDMFFTFGSEEPERSPEEDKKEEEEEDKSGSGFKSQEKEDSTADEVNVEELDVKIEKDPEDKEDSQEEEKAKETVESNTPSEGEQKPQEEEGEKQTDAPKEGNEE